MTAVQVNDVYRFYHTEDDETLALRGVSFSLEQGEAVAVMGPSGSGKSTLLSCVAGIDEPDGGAVFIFGWKITRKPESVRSRIRAEKIGIFLQSGNLFEHLTVEENIHFRRRLAGFRAGRSADELLSFVGLEHRKHSYPSQLSGGEAARGGLMAALANEPEVLLADEPTGEIDAKNEQRVLELLAQYRRSGGSILVVTHSNRVAETADRILLLRDGRTAHEEN